MSDNELALIDVMALRGDLLIKREDAESALALYQDILARLHSTGHP